MIFCMIYASANAQSKSYKIEFQRIQKITPFLNEKQLSFWEDAKRPSSIVSFYTLETDGVNSYYYMNDQNNDINKMAELSADDVTVIYHLNTDTIQSQLNFLNDEFYVNTHRSNYDIEWKMTNETKLIAGYQCYKAVGKVLDSIEINAYFNSDLEYPVGPSRFMNLPGIILAVEIPSMHLLYTAVEISDMKEPIQTPKLSGVIKTYESFKETVIKGAEVFPLPSLRTLMIFRSLY